MAPEEPSGKLNPMARQLSLSARPVSMDALVGQEKTVEAIRGHMKSGRTVEAWLFSGPKGVGKTSMSRILALAYQCAHQKVFGTPCLACRKKKNAFPIYEINAASVTGIDQVRESLQGSDYNVLGEGKYRVYILDEVQQASKSAQSLLLKYLEDSPETTVFILCSTEPQRILGTLRSRCVAYEMTELTEDNIDVLVTRLLEKVQSELPADRLVTELVEHQVYSPRLITQAVEKYVAGVDPKAAAEVDGSTSVDVGALLFSVLKGDWGSAASLLNKARGAEIRPVRLSLIAYMKKSLLESPEIDARTDALSKAISMLCEASNVEDSIQAASMAAVLYRVSAVFAKYKR